MKILVHSERYVVAKLQGGSLKPRSEEGLFAVIADGDGVTVICREGLEPLSAVVQGPWTWLEISGPFGFEETGIIALVSSSLAGAGIPLLSVSSFHRDHFLVESKHLDVARRALGAAGLDVTEVV